MNESHTRNGEFRRVSDNLFRYSSSGVYYSRFQSNGKDICRSLRTTDRALAKRRLADELENASKLDVKVGKMTPEELLRLYVERLGQYAPKTIASRQSILKIFKQTWPHGLNISVHSISTGQLELWLASRVATSVAGCIQQLAVCYVRHGYWFDVTGEIPAHKDPEKTDRKIIEQYCD